MTNKERQASLEKKQTPFANGMYPYCHYCDHNAESVCNANEIERRQNCFCAKAYNRMVRGKGK